jgi:protocatechuate 3,4-dioxygenase beta subunit
MLEFSLRTGELAMAKYDFDEPRLDRRKWNRCMAVLLAAGAVAPARALAGLVTPPQVEGPFYPVDAGAERDVDLTHLEGHSESATGEAILVRGRVLDSDGNALAEAVVDVWQANHHGRYSHPGDPNTAPLDPNFQGWGIMHTADGGEYGFKTIKPGAYPLSFLGETGWRCRHIHFKVSCPGYESLTTQMYFEGDPLIAQDLEIAKAPEESRHLLISSAATDKDSGLPLYRFDVALAKKP